VGVGWYVFIIPHHRIKVNLLFDELKPSENIHTGLLHVTCELSSFFFGTKFCDQLLWLQEKIIAAFED
jgi:hypothetical protein